METQVKAIECVLERLFDYAGIFPPAALELPAALSAYRAYRSGAYAWALGNLVVDVRTLRLLNAAHAQPLGEVPLSVVATIEDAAFLHSLLTQGTRIEMIELKAESPDAIARWQQGFPAAVPTFVEVHAGHIEPAWLRAISAAGFHAKLRLGGVVAQAFPSASSVALALHQLAEKRLAFKATAGLHHALRSQHPFTYQAGSPSGWMHGFLNLLCAAAHTWFGGSAEGAARLLDEQDAGSWHLTATSLRCGASEFSADQLREVRRHFLLRIGSCSFEEPLHDLENLGWL